MNDKIYISQARKEMLLKMPYIETQIILSKNKAYIIHKTIITDIRPIKKYKDLIQETEIENKNTEVH